MKTIIFFFINVLFIMGISISAFSQTTVFEESLGGGSIPSGWSDNNVSYWTSGSSGGPCARLNATSSWIETPSLDLNGWTNITLIYDHGRFGTSGDRYVDIRISTDGGSNWATTITSSQSAASNVTWLENETVNISSAISPTSNVKIRWTSGVVRLRNVKLTGTAPSGGTATITLSTSTLSGFTYVEGNGPSAEQNFSVSGTDLTDNIVITAPSNYEISETSGSGFTSPITLTPSGGTVNATTIYVRLKDGLSVATYNGEDITASSSGAADKTVTCNGSVTGPTPTITLSTSTLSGFTYVEGNGPSAEQNFSVSGTDLTDNIVITAPSNYEISETSGLGFTSPITLTPSGGIVNATTIYVRLKENLSVGTYNSENITASSSGAADKTVTCNGSVTIPIYPEPSNHVTNFDAIPNAHNQITVTWLDATGGQLPIAYLVKAAIAPDMPIEPTDGTVESDALLVKNILHGTEQAVFSGLDASTLYNFAIWPYTNSGTAIDYKTDGSVPSANTTTLSAPVVIFSESIGSTFTTSVISNHTDWDNGSPVVFSGDAAVNNTTTSTGYTGASGSNNIFINNNIGEYFLIEGIDVRGYNNISLSFGHHKSSVSAAGNELKVEVSNNGTTWTDLSYTRADASASWELITPSGTIPSDVENLRIRFTQTNSSTTRRFRVDDITLSGTALPPSNNLTITTTSVIDISETYNNVTIEPTGQLTLEDGVTLTVNGNFVIQSDVSGTGSFIQEGNSTLNVSGTTTVQKYLPYEVGGDQSKGWYVSSAVGSAPYSTFSAADGLYEFSPSAADWVSLDKNATTALAQGKGYVTRFPINQTVSFSGGPLNNGAILNNGLTRQASPNNFGWNLVGNPYPSFIDWDNGINKTNLNNSVHIRKGDGGIATYINGSGLNGGTRYIAPMQAFWVQVQASETTGSIEFTNASRLHNDTIPFFKSSNTPNLMLSINRAVYSDEMLIRFIDGATIDFDPAYDAAKLFSTNENHPQIYTILDAGKEIAINSMPELIANTTVVVGFTTNHADVLEINAANLSSFDSNVEIILEDLYDNTMTNLKQTNSYSFNSATGAFNDRFLVHFNLTTTNTDELNQQQAIVYTYDNAIYISHVVNNKASATLYNMLGQIVFSQELTAHTLNKINTATASGHYVLKIIDGSHTSSHKVHLK